MDQVLATLPAKVAEYRSGKTSLLGMFTGQVHEGHGRQGQPADRCRTLLKTTTGRHAIRLRK